MKIIFIVLIAAATGLTSFAQGKISMSNDSNHLVYFWNGGVQDFPTNVAFSVDLYGGSSVNNLTLQKTVPLSVAGKAGAFGLQVFTSPNLPGGVQAYMQVVVYDSMFNLQGSSEVFMFTPSSSITYNSIVNPVFSTWNAGTVVIPGEGLGAIGIIIPEPSFFSLVGLGLATLMVRRRNK